MDLGIQGRKAIVCASSKGLGKGCAMALAEAGCDVVLNGRNEAVLTATAGEIRARFQVNVTAVPGDVSEPEIQRALLAACPEPDILVNNNGGPPRRPFAQTTRQGVIDGVIQNMVTPIELIRAVLDGMAERRFGRIVNITSLTVLMPVADLDVSSGARAGLTAFLGGVARKVADRNVTINNLLPGKMDTDRLRGQSRAGAELSDSDRKVIADIPARRFGSPEEFGQICAFYCSVHAGYLTCQNVPVDGGLFPGSF